MTQTDTGVERELVGLAHEFAANEIRPVAAHHDEIGAAYTSELARHFRWRGGGERVRRAARLG